MAKASTFDPQSLITPISGNTLPSFSEVLLQVVNPYVGPQTDGYPDLDVELHVGVGGVNDLDGYTGNAAFFFIGNNTPERSSGEQAYVQQIRWELGLGSNTDDTPDTYNDNGTTRAINYTSQLVNPDPINEVPISTEIHREDYESSVDYDDSVNGAVPGDIPGPDWAGDLMSLKPKGGGNKAKLGPGNWMLVVFQAESATTTTSLVQNLLGRDNARFALHINNCGADGESCWADTWPPLAEIPVPAALPLFLSALAGFGFIGWRRRHRAAA